jgi:glucose/arabinose dehydrogenase
MVQCWNMVVACLALSFSISLFSGFAAASDNRQLLDSINLPPGFRISVFAKLIKPRSMTLHKASGVVFVGSRGSALHSLRDSNKDGTADDVIAISRYLNVPNGVAVLGNRLYVAEIDQISWTAIPVTDEKPAFVPIKTDLPPKRHHGWRYLKAGPNSNLYVTIGAPYNIGMPQGMEGSILVLDGDGHNVRTVASGVRNSVGLDFHPATGEMFFTDNGADNMGDDIPPDELNHVRKVGQHYGYPWFGGKDIKLSGYEDKIPPGPVVAPVVNFQAHTASLGITFYKGSQFPAEYKHDAFVAQHGSWNRSSPVGYRIMRIRFDARGNAVGKEVFADGWLQDGKAIGRPVDITELGDGSLLVSDDFANVIYRISYGNQN